MKKTLIQALFCLVTLMCGACTGQSKDDSGKDTPKEFIPTSWNGEFLKAISDAYETFSETDEMPVSSMWKASHTHKPSISPPHAASWI